MKPLILGIETSSRLCSLCFWHEGRAVVYAEENVGFGHAATFFALLEQIQISSGISLKDATHVAVTRGPGSFTGIRVGLAIAKGLSMAGNLPLLGLTCFEVARHKFPSDSHLFAFDTKRNDFYGALYEGGNCLSMGIWTKDDVLKRLEMFKGSFVTDAGASFPEGSVDLTLTAQDVASAACDVLHHSPTIFSQDPFYLRPPKVYE